MDHTSSLIFFLRSWSTQRWPLTLKIFYDENISKLLLLVLWIGSGCGTRQEDQVLPVSLLWYDQPAQGWEEALPLGNGRIGMMLFGDTLAEHIQLNDDSMWPADLGWGPTEGNQDDLADLRKRLMEGKHEEVDKLIVDTYSRKNIVRSHQTLGDLFIQFDHKNITDYRRDLDLETAIASVSYRTDGALVTEKAFVSHPDNAMILVVETEAVGGLNGKINMSRPEDNGYPTATTRAEANGLLIMEGEVTQRGGVFDSKPTPILEGVQFETRLKVVNEGGEVIGNEDYLELKNVQKAVFYIVSNSSYYFENYREVNKQDLKQVISQSLEDVESKHIGDYRNLYANLTLDLGENALDTLPTSQRIERIKSGQTDVGLEQLLFQYGRYLLISCSREGTNPANLQGLWNRHIQAPWNADYHLNINLQMNYWPANVTGLSELNNPLFDYVDRLIESGKVTARKNFGCRGAYLPHATDLWAPTWIRARTAIWGSSFGAGGWMVQHYWHHFKFTQDTFFLKDRAFPALHEIAQFYSDWVIEDPRDGRLISAPSTSPENRFLLPNGYPASTCLGAAMDQQVIAEVFGNYLEAAEILGINNALVDTIKVQLPQLRPGFVIGSDGRILEWDREYEEHEPGHRHMSHLYGFHPGDAISKDQTPEIFEAVRKTLDYRLENGGAGTGWSRAWLVNYSARLLDGDMAYEHIQLLLQKSLYDNLFDAHPPFQIDGNFGYTAGIAEMLVQSHEKGIIRVLPALPTAWKKGSVQGIKARGGWTIDISWEDNQLTELRIYGDTDGRFDLVYGDERIPVTIEGGKPFVYIL